MTPSRIPFAAFPVLLLLALPGVAGALIRIDRSVAGVRLDDSSHRVRVVLGTPSKVIHAANEFGTYTEYRYRRRGVRVSFQGGNHVTNLDVRSRAQRTAKGAGIGTKESTLKALHPKLKCETISGFRSCHTGKFLAGRRVTDFHVRNGRVSRVDLGFVID